MHSALYSTVVATAEAAVSATVAPVSLAAEASAAVVTGLLSTVTAVVLAWWRLNSELETCNETN